MIIKRNTKIALIAICTCVLMLFVNNAKAEQLTSTFQWPAYTATADGFQLYRDTLLNPVGALIPVTDTELALTYEGDGQCHNYWIRVVEGTLFSANSAIGLACPPGIDPSAPQQPPVAIGGFIITTTTVITPQ